MLDVIDEFTRECLSIRIARRRNSTDVIDVLSDLLNGEIFNSLAEAKVIIESRRCHYNT